MGGFANVESKGDISHLPKSKMTFKLILLTTLAVIGGFLFGYDTGVISGANLYLKVEFKMDTIQQESVVSVTVGAAAIFSLVGGVISQYFGRKKTILLSSLLFVVGSIILAASYSFAQLIIGRLIVGIAIGISSTTVPLYIAETSPPDIRGTMITMFQLLITFGLFMASVIDAAFSYITDNDLNWRLMLAFAAVPAALQLIGFLFMPESPRWLVSVGRTDEAFTVLKEVNGGDENAEKIAKHELNLIKVNHEETERARAEAGGKMLFLAMLQSPTIRKALIIGCILQMFQQLTGINTVMYYAATIIQMGGINNNTLAIWLAAVVTAVNFVCTFIGVYLVDKIGRRLLLLGSIIGVILTLIILGVGFLVIALNSPDSGYTEANANGDACGNITNCDTCSYDANCGWCFDNGNRSTGACVAIYDDVNQTLTTAASQWANYGRCASDSEGNPSGSKLHDDSAVWDYGFCPTSYSWLPILGMVLYLCSFSAGFGPTPWIICAEVFPNWARSTGTSITTASNWLFNLVISLTFLSLANAITRQGAYFLYAGITFVGLIFCYLVIPETKKKEIEEIDELLRGPWFHCGKTPKKSASATYYNTMTIDEGLGDKTSNNKVLMEVDSRHETQQ